MPYMDGVGLAAAIRELNSEMPIILLSSIGNEQRRQYDHLFSHILTKPVKQKILSNAITSELRKQGRINLVPQAARIKFSEDFARHYPLNILIAEDNPVNQTLAIRTLKKLGYQATVAANGVLALEALKANRFDIILMDVQMPEMDGIETTQRIRQSEGHQPVIIAMTANAMDEDKEACLQAGMDDYISKPIKLEQLVKALERWSIFLQNRNKQVS